MIDRERVRLWRGAAGVLAMLGAVVLAAVAVRPILAAAVFEARAPESPIALTATVLWRAAVWVMVAAVVLSRWRWPAIAVSVGAVVFEFSVPSPGDGQPGELVGLDPRWWPALALALAALLVAAGPLDVAARHLGPRGRRLLTAIALVAASSALVAPLLIEYHGEPPPDDPDSGFYVIWSIEDRLTRTIAGVTYGLVVTLMVLTVRVVDPAVRRPAAVLLAVGLGTFALVELGFDTPFGVLSGPL